MQESKYIHKSHNIFVLLYHFECPAKYRRVVFSESVDNFRSVPFSIINFSGNTIINSTCCKFDKTASVDGAFLPKYEYYIAMREKGSLDTDPPGRHAVYGKSTGFDRSSYSADHFDGPFLSTVRETWQPTTQDGESSRIVSTSRNSAALNASNGIPYMELDFIFA